MEAEQPPNANPKVPWQRPTNSRFLEELRSFCRPRWTEKSLVVDWTCPRCGASQRRIFKRDVPTVALDVSKLLDWLRRGRGGGRGEVEPRWEAVYLECRCQHPHEGRPQGVARGCGLDGELEVRRL